MTVLRTRLRLNKMLPRSVNVGNVIICIGYESAVNRKTLTSFDQLGLNFIDHFCEQAP